MEEDEENIKATGGQPRSKRDDKVNYTTMSLRIKRTFREEIATEARRHGLTMYNWILSTLESAMDKNKEERELQKESDTRKQFETLNQKLDTITNIVSKL